MRLKFFLRRQPASFAADQRGTVIIEFACVIPMILLIGIGGLILEDGMALYRKATESARSLADLASQYTGLEDSETTTLLTASRQVFAPYPLSDAGVTLAEVAIDKNGNGSIVWSRSVGASGYTAGTRISVPQGSFTPGANVVMGEATYQYQSPVSGDFLPPLTLTKRIFMMPRMSNAVPLLGDS